MRLWRLGDGQPLRILRGHRGAVASLLFSNNGRRLVSSGNDGEIHLWDLDRKENPIVLNNHRGQVDVVGWSPDGSRVFSGGWDGISGEAGALRWLSLRTAAAWRRAMRTV